LHCRSGYKRTLIDMSTNNPSPPDALRRLGKVPSRRWQNPEVEESLLSYDVASASAHVRMLGETGIIDKAGATAVLEALARIAGDLADGKSFLGPADVDIQSGLERRLTEMVGDLAAVLRIAKSRNDQVATDIRLWLRDGLAGIFAALVGLRQELLALAERDLEVVMPGYTHMQPAQPILLSHWWLANEARLRRDLARLRDFYPRLNVLPLGASLLAGTTEPIDRALVANYLGFDDVIENSLDAVSDRDFLIEFGSCAALIGLHLSGMGAELILWATQEYGFIKLHRDFVLRSHKVPFKTNPVLLEVLRSRPSILFGRLNEFMYELKALPIGYSQDLQECLPGLFDVVDTLKLLLEIASALLPGIRINEERMREMACADMLNGLSAMQYLIDRGITEDRAAKVVEQLSSYCRQRQKYLSDLALSEWQQFSPAFESDVYEYVTMEQSVEAYCSYGATSRDQVEQSLVRAREALALDIQYLGSHCGLVLPQRQNEAGQLLA
jgi:argininosuccinate lyase